MNAFNPDHYLTRIDYTGDITLTEEGLRSLHRYQLFSIPFENFDVLLKRPILVDTASLVDKLVNRRRGGYCFELNGLFLHVLSYFGFDVRALLARVHVHGTPGGRSHQLSLVTFNDRQWLADVGFGSFNMREPIPFERNRETSCDGQTLRLVDAPPYGTMLQARTDEGWKSLYSFDMEYVGPADIKMGNHYSSTHPDSNFMRNRIAFLPTRTGSVSLLNSMLKIVRDGNTSVVDVPDAPSFIEAVRTHFSIELDAACDVPPPPDTAREQPDSSL